MDELVLLLTPFRGPQSMMHYVSFPLFLSVASSRCFIGELQTSIPWRMYSQEHKYTSSETLVTMLVSVCCSMRDKSWSTWTCRCMRAVANPMTLLPAQSIQRVSYNSQIRWSVVYLQVSTLFWEESEPFVQTTFCCFLLFWDRVLILHLLILDLWQTGRQTPSWSCLDVQWVYALDRHSCGRTSKCFIWYRHYSDNCSCMKP